MDIVWKSFGPLSTGQDREKDEKIMRCYAFFLVTITNC